MKTIKRIIENVLLIKGIIIIIIIEISLEICIYTKIDYGFHLYFLDIGQGDSILIKTPGYKYVLVDGGEDQEVIYELGEIIPFWHKKIDIVIGTHSDCDHIGGIKFVLKKYLVNEVLLNYKGDEDKNVKEIVNLCKEMNININEIYEKSRIYIENMELDIMWPKKREIYDNDNQKSIVITGNIFDKKFLLTGDIEEEQENEIINGKGLGEVEILKISHHGSKTATGKEILQKGGIKYAIISCGLENRFNHPAKETIERLEEDKIEIFRTDINGRIEFLLFEDKMKIKLEKN